MTLALRCLPALPDAILAKLAERFERAANGAPREATAAVFAGVALCLRDEINRRARGEDPQEYEVEFHRLAEVPDGELAEIIEHEAAARDAKGAPDAARVLHDQILGVLLAEWHRRKAASATQSRLN